METGFGVILRFESGWRTLCVGDLGAGWPWPLPVRTARVIKNQLRLGLWLITGDRRKGIRTAVVNMGITLLSSGIM